MEASTSVILAAIEAHKDITLAELLATMLREDHGVSFDPSTIWSCLDRHRIIIKRQRTQPNRSGQTSPHGAGLGSRRSLTSTRSAWCSLMRSEPRSRWPDCVAGPNVANAAGLRCPMVIGKPRPSQARSGWAA